MPQLAPQADGLIDTITTQKEAVASLTQTVARGVPALRDAAENVLELNPATSTPLLTSNANDIGLSYNSAVLAVVDQTGQEQRPLTADKVVVGDGATEINAGGFSGQSATLSDYLYVAGSGNSSVFIRNGDATATGIVRGTGATFGGVDIGNGGGMATYGRSITCNNSVMDAAGFAGLQGTFGGVAIGNGALRVGNTAVDGNGIFGNNVNGFGAAFGGVGIDNGRVHVGGTVLDGNGVAGFQGTFGGVAMGGGAMRIGNTAADGNGLFGNQVNGFGAAFGGCSIANNTYLGNGVGCNIANFGNTNAGVLSYTALVPPPSERAMKTEQSLISNGLDVVRLLVPARWRWREQPRPLGSDGPEIDPPVEDTAVHASVYVDEVAEVAPELIIDRPDGARSYDDRGLIAYLISAVQTLADRNDALTARLDALEAT